MSFPRIPSPLLIDSSSSSVYATAKRLMSSQNMVVLFIPFTLENPNWHIERFQLAVGLVACWLAPMAHPIVPGGSTSW